MDFDAFNRLTAQQQPTSQGNNFGGALGAIFACVGVNFANGNGIQGPQGLMNSYIPGPGQGIFGNQRLANSPIARAIAQMHQDLAQMNRDCFPQQAPLGGSDGGPQISTAPHHGVGPLGHQESHVGPIAAPHGTGTQAHAEIGAPLDTPGYSRSSHSGSGFMAI